MAVRASEATSRAASSLLSQASWLARVCLLVTVRRGVGWGGGDGGDDSGGGDSGNGCGSGSRANVEVGETKMGLGEVVVAACAGGIVAVACSVGVGLRALRRLGGVNDGGVDGRGGIVSGDGRCLSVPRSTL